MIRNSASAVLLVALAGCACAGKSPPTSFATPPPPSPGACPSLQQGWDCDRLRQFWFTDQGSKLMPYQWLLHLERADARRSLKDSLPQYGFIPDPNADHDKLNPDRLPIGWANHKNDKKDRTDWAGLTCAACHTTRIDYQDQQYFVEGAPNLLDFDTFYADVVAALRATLDDVDGRFVAFQHALETAGAPTTDLRGKLKTLTEYLEHRARINATPLHGGPGRVDAFGQIFNQMLVIFMGNPDSTAVPASAPVSFPFLWDIAQHEAVQWNGSAPNLGVEGPGSVLRNIGEVLGVFGEIYDLGTPDYYETSAVVPNLRAIESWITVLRAPRYPFPIDAAAAARGKAVYAEAACSKCHAVIDQPRYPLPVAMTPVDEVQTDSRMLDQFNLRRGNTRMLRGRAVGIARNPFQRFKEIDAAKDVAGHLSAGGFAFVERPGAMDKLSGYLKLLRTDAPDFVSYKARPLDGIWATAPFLHNGSVPSLQQLLEAPEARATSFCVGDRQFDPVNVGYRTTCGEGASPFDATKYGNGNIGHAYGTTLPVQKKKDLLEYLKTL